MCLPIHLTPKETLMNIKYPAQSAKTRALAMVFSCIISTTLMSLVAVGLTSPDNVALVAQAGNNADALSNTQCA
jgi:hypothetical protein